MYVYTRDVYIRNPEANLNSPKMEMFQNFNLDFILCIERGFFAAGGGGDVVVVVVVVDLLRKIM